MSIHVHPWVKIIALALACAATAPAALLLRHVQLVDPAAKKITSTDLLIGDDGRITALAEKITAPAGAQVLDLTGKFVTPGFIDLHVHSAANALPNGQYEDLGPRPTARRMLACGVLAFLDLGTDLDEIFPARDRQRAPGADTHDEADIYAAGQPFARWSLKSAAAAPGIITAFITQRRPDAIKLLYAHNNGRASLDRPTLTAAVTAAHAAGVKTVCHISTWADARDAIAAGSDALTHFEDDNPIPADLVALWAAHREIVSIPTMAVQLDLALFADHPALFMANKLLREVAAPASLLAYDREQFYSNKSKGTIAWQREDRANDLSALRQLAAAGVTVLTGSDTTNLGTFQGFSEHREMKLFADAGLSAWDALAAGTTRAADFLGRPHGIRRGERAGLVILDADPTADIENTQKISAIIHHGKLVDRAALLAEVK